MLYYVTFTLEILNINKSTFCQRSMFKWSFGHWT